MINMDYTELILNKKIKRILRLPGQDFTDIEYESGEEERIYKRK